MSATVEVYEARLTNSCSASQKPRACAVAFTRGAAILALAIPHNFRGRLTWRLMSSLFLRAVVCAAFVGAGYQSAAEWEE
jgi:hypothetical protein